MEVTPGRLKEIRERAHQQACKLLFGAHWEQLYSTPLNELSYEAQEDIMHYTLKLTTFAQFERGSAERETLALAIKWIRKNCQVDTGDGIYGDASRYTKAEISRAIHELAREKGKVEP